MWYEELIDKAKEAQQGAYPWKSGIKVGCAIKANDGAIYKGANIEGLWMTSIHAEVAAIIKMVNDDRRGIEIALMADAEFFTPCGGCIDWLMQFCVPDSPIVILNNKNKIWQFKLKNLCPYYPKK